jgi:hypothetical protein
LYSSLPICYDAARTYAPPQRYLASGRLCDGPAPCGTAGRPLDRALLLEAVRMADLLLVHEADRYGLATAWSEGEGGQAR